jgi:hypothetical protein
VLETSSMAIEGNSEYAIVRVEGRQMSHWSIQTKLDISFKLASLRSKTSTISESSVDE